MEHGITWLSFLPGFAAWEAWAAAHHRGLLGGRMTLQHVLAAVLVAAVLLLVGWRTRATLRQAGENAVVPEPHISCRNLVELIAEALLGQMRQAMGADYRRYFPVLATFALFILFSNLLGLVPGMTPPTDNWNTTFACGLFVFVYVQWHGLRSQGLGHLAHMANPTGERWGWFLAPLMFPIELVSHLSRPFSLGVRLAANMMGDHAVLLGFLSLVPVLIPLPFMLLGLIVSVVQTLVFVLLSIIYLALATHDPHAEAHHA